MYNCSPVGRGMEGSMETGIQRSVLLIDLYIFYTLHCWHIDIGKKGGYCH